MGRTARTAPFAESRPALLPRESPGISDWQIEDFMAPAAILNSSVMKACRSITHLFVFLLLWITVSIADSSLEWNENKTIIHRVKLCRKGKKAMISFRSSALSPWWVTCFLGNKERQLPGGRGGGFWLPLLEWGTFPVPIYRHPFCGLLRRRRGTLGWQMQVNELQHDDTDTVLSLRSWGSMTQVALGGRELLPHHWRCTGIIGKLT